MLEVVALILAVAAPALAPTVSPAEALDTTSVHVAGAAAFGLGLVGVFVAQEAMGASWRIGVDPADQTRLVTGGPFRLVRNPIYSSLVLVVGGSALLAPNWLAFLGLGLMVASVEVQARLAEEPHLLRVHGSAYAAYAARVGRFLPGIGRLE